MTIVSEVIRQPVLERTRKSVRVLFVLDDSELGPAPVYVTKLLRRFKRMQVVPAICTIALHGDGTERMQGQDVSVVSLEGLTARGWRGGLSSLTTLMRARHLMRKYEPDIVHLIGARARIIGGFAASSVPSVKLVSSMDASTPNRGLARLAENLGRRVGVEPAVVVDEAAEKPRRGTRRGFLDTGRYVAGSSLDRSAARSAAVLGFESLAPAPCTVGLPLIPGELDAAREMFAAFRIFGAGRPDARLVVFAGRAESRLDGWIDDLGLGGRVFFVEPPIEPASILRRMSVVWVHGRQRPDSRWILEAMNVGIPVVCDQVTPLVSAIERWGGALMRDRLWPRQFAEATEELQADPELRQRVGEGGRKLCDELCDFAAHAERVRDLYGWLVHGEPIAPTAS